MGLLLIIDQVRRDPQQANRNCSEEFVGSIVSPFLFLVFSGHLPMTFIILGRPAVRNLILAAIIWDGTCRLRYQPPLQLQWDPPVSTVRTMPKRKDQALSPVMSPGSPDGSRRGWDWMKGKFQRRISGRFKNVANEDSQDLTSFDSPDRKLFILKFHHVSRSRCEIHTY